ncbi:MAG TPA: CvpA family protein [Candidatus Dormibacteraeota bacterium]|nr:CvpA family protein [Candidatus Dormibacteraeota bacterium]
MSALSNLALLAATPVPSPSASVAASSASALGASLPILDGLIVIVLLIALYIGYQRGIIQPLMTYLFFFGALFLIYRDRTNYLNAIEHYLHASVVLAIFLALIIAVVAGYAGGVVGQALHRMPVARGVDGLLGIFLNVGIALLVIYFLLEAMIVFDRAFTPFVNQAKMTNAQVTALSKEIETNPLAAALVDPKDLQTLKDETKKGQTTTLSTVTQLDNLSTFYEDFVRPQLQHSRLAPYIMRFGQKVPLIGHLGSADLPPNPDATPTPSPAPKPSPVKK